MRPLLLAFFAVLALAQPVRADVQETWTKRCKSCHGEDGSAQTTIGRKQKIKDMTNPAWQAKNSDAHIRGIIENGVKDTKMKPFKEKLQPEEIDALVQYIRGFKK